MLPGEARGPAAARNTGLRAVTEPWVVFVDDDVQVGPHWCAQLQRDLDEATPDTAGVPGVITVPLPGGRRPTDWERGTAGLARARWITADMAYRTDVLRRAGGFDERFPRAHREDADLALRLLGAGWRIRRGRRTTLHPVRAASRWASVRTQRGHADDGSSTTPPRTSPPRHASWFRTASTGSSTWPEAPRCGRSPRWAWREVAR